MNRNQYQAIREQLLRAYNETGMWGVVNPVWELPQGVARGSDDHLSFLTLVYTISGGRESVQLWEAARQTFVDDAQLFDLQFLAYAKPSALVDRLNRYGLTKKASSEATTWQRIGQALMMRAGGSVQRLLADHAYDAQQLMIMLTQSKTTFPLLSGPQTAPRWLYGLTAVAEQSLKNVNELPVPISPHAKRALMSLNIQVNKISAMAFAPTDALGRYGCHQRKQSQTICPGAHQCPVVIYCEYAPK